ncbi:aspartate kinase [Acidaminobacter sp. JC074]|uniref:aspartate kinase n=1 Tax=Acidaminobacter sp. JC074 TaxID=2530199 RepID=UPI001F0ECB59|nr:aspartate kinase [Acidaminobacter sp. JC074]
MPRILKFGGTSVATIDQIKKIAKFIKERHEDEQLVVVVSAMGKTTDRLVKMIKEISETPSKRELDMLLATGEQITIPLLSTALREEKVNAISLTGAQAGIQTSDHHSKARIESINCDLIQKHLEAGTVVVVAGFQGISATGDITTLGRGGSDTTAVALAVALGGTCEIYTDVEGIYTVDPRYNKNARKLTEISYQEMLEMASLGAGVLETRAIEMAHKFKVPLYVAKTLSKTKGTSIIERTKEMESTVITGISIDTDCLMASVKHLPFSQENIAELFMNLANRQLNIDMISIAAPYNDHVTVSFTAEKDDAKDLEEVIQNMKKAHNTIEITTNNEIVKLSVVGIGMVSHSGVAANIFRLFAEENIHYYQVTTSEISISYTILKSDVERCIDIISKEYELEK